jgi:hypothetical protein
VEDVEVLEVPEIELDPGGLTEQARNYLPMGMVVVREVCRVKKLVYRFLDKDGKSVTANVAAVKATIEGDLSRADIREGSLVLENVGIAIGKCIVFYSTPALTDEATTRAYVAKVGAEGFEAEVRHGVVRVVVPPSHAQAAASVVEAQGRRLMIQEQLEGTPSAKKMQLIKDDMINFDRKRLEFLRVH